MSDETCKIQLTDMRTAVIGRSKTEGLKFDEGKQPWFAMPLVVLEPLADVFAFGETRYETFNCLLPFENPNRRFYDGQMRHTRATQIDPLKRNEEDGNVYELAQVAFNALMRLYQARLEAGLLEKGDVMSHGTEIDRLNNTISQQAELIGWLKAELDHVKATLEALIKQNVAAKDKSLK